MATERENEKFVKFQKSNFTKMMFDVRIYFSCFFLQPSLDVVFIHVEKMLQLIASAYKNHVFLYMDIL